VEVQLGRLAGCIDSGLEEVRGQQEVIRGTEFAERKLRSQFRDEVRRGAVVEIHGGHHWIFVSHREQVVAAVRRFLLQP